MIIIWSHMGIQLLLAHLGISSHNTSKLRDLTFHTPHRYLHPSCSMGDLVFHIPYMYPYPSCSLGDLVFHIIIIPHTYPHTYPNHTCILRDPKSHTHTIIIHASWGILHPHLPHIHPRFPCIMDDFSPHLPYI